MHTQQKLEEKIILLLDLFVQLGLSSLWDIFEMSKIIWRKKNE